jgi:hypothetical protein
MQRFMAVVGSLTIVGAAVIFAMLIVGILRSW